MLWPYRPKRAVAAFVAWLQNSDQRTKAAYYPTVEKRSLFAYGYIAAQSSHSTGLAVDLGVKGWDFGVNERLRYEDKEDAGTTHAGSNYDFSANPPTTSEKSGPPVHR